MLSIPATKAFEIGSGFRGTEVPGSKHNDLFVKREDGRLGTVTNWSGGVQGGITNGEDIYFRWVNIISVKTEFSAEEIYTVLASSRPPPFPRRRTLLSTMAQRARWQLVAGTILVLFPELFPSWKRWQPWSSWTNC